MADAAEVIIFLERHLVFVRDRHRHAGRRYEFQIRESSPGVVNDRIEYEVETAHVAADDGADLGSVSARVPMCRVETEFEADPIKEFAFGGLRRDEQRPQLEDVVTNAVVPGDRMQWDTDAGFNPREHSVTTLA